MNKGRSGREGRTLGEGRAASKGSPGNETKLGSKGRQESNLRSDKGVASSDNPMKEKTMAQKPIYTSKSTVKSLWQEYRIYADRVEFDTHFGKLIVPFDQIEKVEISESEVKGLLRGDLHLRNFRPALKLDWANFLEHVVLDKSQGIRRILFTPDDLVAFKTTLEKAIADYRKTK